MNIPRVLILAGGLGTRLAGLLNDVPKPMAPIAGRPFLEYQIEFLKAQGFSRFTLLTGHLSEKIESHFESGRRFGVEITYSAEETPLGTGGAIRLAIENSPDEHFLILNGDSFFATDYFRFVRLGRPPLSIALKFANDLSRYGAVTLDHNGLITDFLEKSSSSQDRFINAGVYSLNREALSYFPKGKSSIEKDVFEPLSHKGVIHGVPCGGKFIDIGTPESWAWSQDRLPGWLQQKFRPCLFLDRDGVIVEHIPYLHDPKQAKLVPQTIEVIRAAKKAGWWVAVVSNQSGVAREKFLQTNCENTNRFIQGELEKLGAGADTWNCCYDHPSAASLRRKPSPGMALEVCDHLPIDLAKSLMIGDNETDQLDLSELRTLLVKGDFQFRDIRPGTKVASDFDELRRLAMVQIHKS